MRKIAFVLCLVLIFGLLCGCESEEAYVPTGNALEDATVATQATAPGVLEQEAQTFSIAYYTADGFNPYLCEGFTNRQVFSLLYQSLFNVDRNYHVEPVLCKSYTMSKDMKTHTFELEVATFSDGSYLNARDVVASLQTAWDNSVYKGRFRNIQSIQASGSRTIVITTTTAYENLPLILDVPIVKEEDVEEAMPLGTGPYILLNTAGGLSLQRRGDWWCKAELAIELDSIPMWPANTPAQIRDWFEFDDLGIAYADPGAASYVDYRCDYEVWDCETGIMLYLGCNAASTVFSNAEVRAALTYAIDRSKILEQCYNGFGQAAVLAASPNSPFYDKTLASQVDYEPERLSKALSDNALTGSTIRLLVNKSDSVRLQAARLIAQMLTDCGLVVEIQDNSTSYFREAVYAGNFDLYLGQTQLSANMDLSDFFAPHGNLRWGALSNSATYAMCQKALENSGNYYNLHQMILRDGQLTPILFRTYAVYMERGLLSGLSPSRDNVFWYSLGKSMEDIMTVEE